MVCAVFSIVITTVTNDITLFIVAKIKVSCIGCWGEHSWSSSPQQQRFHPMGSSCLTIYCPCHPSYLSSWPSSSRTSSKWRQLWNSQRRPQPYNNPISCACTPLPLSETQFGWRDDPTQTVDWRMNWRHATALKRGHAPPRMRCNGPTAYLREGVRANFLRIQMDGGSDCLRRLWRLMEGCRLVCDCILWHVLSKNQMGS